MLPKNISMDFKLAAQDELNRWVVATQTEMPEEIEGVGWMFTSFNVDITHMFDALPKLDYKESIMVRQNDGSWIRLPGYRKP